MLNLTEYKPKPDRLADHLPWAMLIAPGVVLNKDGSFQRSARFRGPDLESATQEELMAFHARMNDVLKRFGSGWALFLEADRHESLEYPVSQFPDPVSHLVDEERRAAFEEEGAHFETSTYLTLTFLPPVDNASRAEEVLFERDDDTHTSYQDHLTRFILETDKVFDLLSELTSAFVVLDDAKTLTYLHSTISTKRHDVIVPDIPVYLDAVLVDTSLTGGLEPMLGDQHLRTLTILGFPNMTVPGILDELNHLPFAFRWVTRFVPLDKVQAIKELERYRRQWFAKRKSVTAILKEVLFNESSALVDSDADNKAIDADAALQELGSDDVAFGTITITLTVMDHTREGVTEKLRAIDRVITGRGFTTITETMNAVEAWLSSLPGQVYANIRQPLVHTLNLSHLAPLASIWAGPTETPHLGGPPLFYGATYGVTPFRFALHVGDVGHELIVGPTGAGKSVLLSFMCLQFQRYEGAQVFIFDKGASARAVTLALDGAYYDLGSSSDLAFQPLKDLPLGREQSWAQEWLIELLTAEGLEMTPERKQALWSAIVNLAEAPVKERTLTGLSLLMQDKDLREALYPFTLDGAHGALLDADYDTLSDKPIQCFEMEALMEQGSSYHVLTFLFHRLSERFDGRPTLLILDEAWLFLDHALFASRIREWLKTLRKKNVSVIFATQSLSDIAESSIAPALIESCPTRIGLGLASGKWRAICVLCDHSLLFFELDGAFIAQC